MNAIKTALAGKQVMVTGGSGGIGGRLVEKLILECGAKVTVLMRDLKRAPRVARFPIKIVHGDVTNPADVAEAVKECDVVFHCAYGNAGSAEQQRIVNVDGTRNVMEACLKANVKRVVHISTCRVYGVITPDEDLDETAPYKYSDNPYTDSKLDAEKIVFNYYKEHKLPVSVIQPTTVYGPFVPVWTLNLIGRMKAGRTILINGGDGVCNAVYVDDLVNGILLAAIKDDAIGEAFLISGKPVTWKDFYECTNQMVGGAGMVNMSILEAEAAFKEKKKQQKCRSVFIEPLAIIREEKEIQRRIRRTCEIAAIRNAAKAILPANIKEFLSGKKKKRGKPQQSPALKQVELPIHVLTIPEVHYFAAKTRFVTDKAERLLGYQPAFSFDQGMQITEKWARWSNLDNE